MERGLLHEREYDAERAERLAGARLSRRGLLRLGGASAGVAALSTFASAPAVAQVPGIVKPTPADLFIERSTNAEMRWSAMKGQGYLTPIDRFFVRNHTSTPRLDAATWRLRIHGSGVEREVFVSYDDLLALPQVSLTRFIECAGNARNFFGTQQGQAAAGTAW